MARNRDSAFVSASRSGKDKVKAVLQHLYKDDPLTPKQREFCDEACILRFLRARGNSSRRAAKHLRACLAFRDSIRIEHLIADEFSAELSQGLAYVAGRDNEKRPVIIVKLNSDYVKRDNSHKMYARLFVFTMEVAIASMLGGVEQCVLLFDAGCFKSGSICLNFVMGTLKILADYYPGRINKAFVIDPPLMFNCLWKGVRAFMDFDVNVQTVCSQDYDSPFMTGMARSSSMRHDLEKKSSNTGTKTVGTGYSSLLSPYNARCLSFGSPASSRIAPTTPTFHEGIHSCRFDNWSCSRPAVAGTATPTRSSWTPFHRSAKEKQRPESPRQRIYSYSPRAKENQYQCPSPRGTAPSPMSSFFHGFKKDSEGGGHKKERGTDCFRAYLRHFRTSYNESGYRLSMKPPLGGLASLVSPDLKRGPRSHLRTPSYDSRRSSYEFKR